MTDEHSEGRRSGQQVEFDVEGENRLLRIKLSGQSWVSVTTHGREIARNRRRDPEVKFFLRPGSYEITTDGLIESLIAEEPKSVQPAHPVQEVAYSQLYLTCDTPDRHEVDGVAEIPADGNSFCTIQIEKTDSEGAILGGEQGSDRLFLRATGGTLMDPAGEQRIRSVDLVDGKAAFRLVSEQQPKVVAVSVFGKAARMEGSELLVEFI